MVAWLALGSLIETTVQVSLPMTADGNGVREQKAWSSKSPALGETIQRTPNSAETLPASRLPVLSLNALLQRGLSLATSTESAAWLYPLLVILNAPGVAAKIDVGTLISQTRQLSMSGILGILETNILYADPGSSQPEIWRLAQGTLGMGSLRVLGKICEAPCSETLHLVHGVKPPEAVRAREVWLRQESWTELSALDMGREDTSYHRINQGSGPQGRLLWNWDEIEAERKLWGAAEGEDEPGMVSRMNSGDSSALTLGNRKPNVAWAGVNTSLSVMGRGREEISEGTTDKWWMDRWQTEALGVASAQDLTLEEACDLLTTAYFGRSTGRRQQILAGIGCFVLTVGTGFTAWYSNWSWITQFFALSCLGYFVNWTASLRAWKFQPANAARRFKPKIRKSWPTKMEMGGGGAIRIAVQSSGIGHLRDLILVPKDILDAARLEAQTKRGRYKAARENNELKIPYSPARTDEHNHWISFEAQASFYGLLVSIETDNARQRSLGILWTIVDGISLLILGFGASIPKRWSGYILICYVAGIALALFARRRSATWTMPEFAKVDFTAHPIDIPPTIRERVIGKRGTESLMDDKNEKLGVFSFVRRHRLKVQTHGRV